MIGHDYASELRELDRRAKAAMQGDEQISLWSHVIVPIACGAFLLAVVLYATAF